MTHSIAKNQSQRKKTVTIPNWTHFGVEHTIIELVEHHNPEDHDDVIYNGFVTIFLIDGEREKKGLEKVISLNTAIFEEDRYDAALRCATLSLDLFGRVSRNVYVFNDEGDMIDEFEIDEEDFFDDENIYLDTEGNDTDDDNTEEETTVDDVSMNKLIPKKRVLH